jgi:hypothetical protein
VRHAVHDRHRDLVPVLALVSHGLGDVALFPGNAEVIGHSADYLARILAQMAAGLGVERDSRLTHWR